MPHGKICSYQSYVCDEHSSITTNYRSISSLRHDGYDDKTNDREKIMTSFIVFVCLSILLLSMAGLPPLAGFIAKFYVFKAVVISGYMWIAVIGIIGSVISAYYYLNIIKVMYLDELEESFTIDSKVSMKIILLISSLLILTFIVYADNFINFMSYISRAIVL